MENVRAAVDRLVLLLGGWGEYVRPGETIVLKPNLLMRKKPEDAVTTHPAIVETVAGGVIGAGGKAIIADSPGGPFNQSLLRWVYNGCGMTAAAERSGAELNFNTGEGILKAHPGGVIASAAVIGAVAGADGVISLSKLKTHGLTRLTGAVKNLYGVVPGLKKAEYHLKMPDCDDFSAMLVDVAGAVSPRLHIMDAVTVMEGKGPSAGDPLHVGILMACACPHTLDLVAACMVGVEPEEVPTLAQAIKRGYIDRGLDKVRLMGDAVSMPRVRIRLLSGPGGSSRSRKGLVGGIVRRAGSSLRPHPEFDREKCVRCGNCVVVCPSGAIGMDGDGPRADLEKCIRCFCCQELCPQGAVEIGRSSLGRLIFK